MPSLAGGRVSFGCMHAFANLVVCDGVPLKANQARVIQLFKGVLHAELTSYLLCDDPERLPYRARRAVMATMRDGAAWDPKYIKVHGRPSSAPTPSLVWMCMHVLARFAFSTATVE